MGGVGVGGAVAGGWFFVIFRLLVLPNVSLMAVVSNTNTWKTNAEKENRMMMMIDDNETIRIPSIYSKPLMRVVAGGGNGTERFFVHHHAGWSFVILLAWGQRIRVPTFNAPEIPRAIKNISRLFLPRVKKEILLPEFVFAPFFPSFQHFPGIAVIKTRFF